MAEGGFCQKLELLPNTLLPKGRGLYSYFWAIVALKSRDPTDYLYVITMKRP